MRYIALLTVILIALPAFAAEPVIGPTAIRQLASNLLREEAIAKSDHDKSSATVALCDLYVAIRQHPLYDDYQPLRGKGASVRHRLLTISDTIADRLKRANVTRPDFSSVIASALDTNNASGKVGGAAPGDFNTEGWALVELIQQTIHRDTWDVTGGPGTIYYYGLSRALVVRATTEVHQDLAALLGKL